MARTPEAQLRRAHIFLSPRAPHSQGSRGGPIGILLCPTRRKRESLSYPRPSAVLTSPSKSQVPAVPPTSTSGPSQVPLTRGSWSFWVHPGLSVPGCSPAGFGFSPGFPPGWPRTGSQYGAPQSALPGPRPKPPLALFDTNSQAHFLIHKASKVIRCFPPGFRRGDLTHTLGGGPSQKEGVSVGTQFIVTLHRSA